jgi:heat shock protein HslJ
MLIIDHTKRPVLKKHGITTACALLFALLLPFQTSPGAGTQGVPAADLGGITIRSDRFSSGAVTLRNGEYREPVAPGSAAATIVKLTDRRAFGAVNGRDAAAVVIVTNTGGSGTFYDLALLVKGEGGWVNVDTYFLGDRVKVHSVGMEDNEISVAMTMHGPDDALCCPTQERTRRFTIQADRLIAQEGEKRTESIMRGIVGPVWRWARTRYADDTTLARAPDAAGYTVQLRRDGTIHVRGDCNVSGGSFILKDTELSIMITHSTRAACPEGSLEDAFIRDLNRTGRFLLKNGGLYLDLKLDSGTMEFHE